MGQKLGCGAHLAEISRLAVGEFSLEQAIKLEELAEGTKAGKFADYLIKLENLLPNFPRAGCCRWSSAACATGRNSMSWCRRFSRGRVEAAPGATASSTAGKPRAAKLRVFNQQNKLIAIAESGCAANVSAGGRV